MDIFEEKGIKPMLIHEQQEAFDSPNYIYELKLDGIRCIAYLDKDIKLDMC
jgi:bifunctional non-homologous end joining protein LigD